MCICSQSLLRSYVQSNNFAAQLLVKYTWHDNRSGRNIKLPCCRSHFVFFDVQLFRVCLQKLEQNQEWSETNDLNLPIFSKWETHLIVALYIFRLAYYLFARFHMESWMGSETNVVMSLYFHGFYLQPNIIGFFLILFLQIRTDFLFYSTKSILSSPPLEYKLK